MIDFHVIPDLYEQIFSVVKFKWLEAIACWKYTDREREQHREAQEYFRRWLTGDLSGAQVQIDQSKTFLLLAVGGELHLISRKKKWRATLDSEAVAMYQKRGRRAFRTIHRHLSSASTQTEPGSL